MDRPRLQVPATEEIEKMLQRLQTLTPFKRPQLCQLALSCGLRQMLSASPTMVPFALLKKVA
jgi:hypothetical protein